LANYNSRQRSPHGRTLACFVALEQPRGYWLLAIAAGAPSLRRRGEGILLDVCVLPYGLIRFLTSSQSAAHRFGLLRSRIATRERFLHRTRTLRCDDKRTLRNST